MVSEQLKNYRKRNKLTQQQIADMLKIDRSTYAYYENRKHTPSISILTKLSQIYDVPIGFLLGETGVLGDDTSFYNQDDNKKNDEKEAGHIYLSEISKAEQDALILFRLINDKDAAMKALKEICEKEDK